MKEKLKRYGVNKPTDLIYMLIGFILFGWILGLFGIGKNK
jgi:hypothetical protein